MQFCDCHTWPQVVAVLNLNIKYLSSFDDGKIKREKNQSLKHIRTIDLQPLLQCTQDQTLEHQADNYVQKDANSSGLHTDTPYPPCVRLALPISKQALNKGHYSRAKLRSISCPDLREDLNNSTFGTD